VPLRRRPRLATPRGTYTEWWWPPSPTIYRTIPAGYTTFEHVVRPEVDPGAGAAYLWFHQFHLVGGEGGYLGLQTDGDGAGKVAVFSISNSLSSPCRIHFAWETGRAYRMRVWTDDAGTWSAAVADERGGGENIIGHIRVPPGWRRLGSWSVMSTEYRGGALTRCQDLRLSQVVFSEPTADKGTVKPQRQVNRVGPGTCEGSSVEDVPGGVRHTMGGLM
jgi:hypothetical protein